MDFHETSQLIGFYILSLRDYNFQEILRDKIETDFEKWKDNQTKFYDNTHEDFTYLKDDGILNTFDVISLKDANIFYYLKTILRKRIWTYIETPTRLNNDLIYSFGNQIKRDLLTFEYEYEKIKNGLQEIETDFESYKSHDLNKSEYYASFEVRITLCKDFLYFLTLFSKDFVFELSEQDKKYLNIIDKKFEFKISNTDLPEIDLSTQKDQIRLLYELGIIDYLISKYPNTLKGNNNQVASLIGKILKIKTQTIQPTINTLLNETTSSKNYPQITINVKAIIDKLESNKKA